MVVELKPKQYIAIEALLQAPSITAASETAGCTKKTLLRWMDDPAFMREYHHERRQRLQVALNQVGKHTAEATDTLASLLHAGSESVRRSAAKDLLEFASRLATDDLEQRLVMLEERIDAMTPDDPERHR